MKYLSFIKTDIRIGLDIDDCLVDFWGAYCKYFNTKDNPNLLQDYIITRNVERILKKDKDFWMSLEIKNIPNFCPTLYCTKRVISKNITKKYFRENNFPCAPIYQQYYQKGKKSTLIKGKVDVFIDDSVRNMIELNLAGIPCLLYSTENNNNWGPYGRIYSITKEEILDTYYLFKSTIFPNFKNILF